MTRLKAFYAALVKRLRFLAGLQDGETLHPLMIALYSILGLSFVVLLLAVITSTPLECIPSGGCDRLNGRP